MSSARRTPSPPWVEGLQPYQPGKPIEELERELGIRDSIKLASNENPLGPSPRAIEAMQRMAVRQHLYPDAAAFYLRERIAAMHGVRFEEVCVGNGSNEVITLLARAFCSASDRGVVSQYGFIAYAISLAGCGAAVTTVPAVELGHDLDAMAAACDSSTRLVFVANPNNPTGTLHGRAAMASFLERVPEDVLVVLDEAYHDYVTDPAYASGLALRDRRANLCVLRTFSKVYGLAGMRVGYGIGPSWVIERLNRMRDAFNVSAIAQAAALAALDDEEFVRRSVHLNTVERARLMDAFLSMGLDPVPSAGNFLLVRTRGGVQALYDRMLRQGVILRPLRPYGLLDHIRVTIGTEQQNTRLLGALRQVVSDLASGGA